MGMGIGRCEKEVDELDSFLGRSLRCLLFLRFAMFGFFFEVSFVVATACRLLAVAGDTANGACSSGKIGL